MSALAELDHTAPEPIILQIAQDTIDFDVQSHQGYSLCGWNKAGLNYLIISELNRADMEKFEDQLRDRTE